MRQKALKRPLRGLFNADTKTNYNIIHVYPSNYSDTLFPHLSGGSGCGPDSHYYLYKAHRIPLHYHAFLWPLENSLSRAPLRRSQLTPLYDLQLTPYYDVKLTPASNVN